MYTTKLKFNFSAKNEANRSDYNLCYLLQNTMTRILFLAHIMGRPKCNFWIKTMKTPSYQLSTLFFPSPQTNIHPHTHNVPPSPWSACRSDGIASYLFAVILTELLALREWCQGSRNRNTYIQTNSCVQDINEPPLLKSKIECIHNEAYLFINYKYYQ